MLYISLSQSPVEWKLSHLDFIDKLNCVFLQHRAGVTLLGNSHIDLPLRSNQTCRTLSSKTFARLPVISTFPVYTFSLSAQNGEQCGQLLVILEPDKTVTDWVSAKQWDAGLWPGFRPVQPCSFPVTQEAFKAYLSNRSIWFIFHKTGTIPASCLLLWFQY